MKSKSLKFTLPAAVVLVLVLVLTVYNHDVRFEVFISDLDGVTDEIVDAITANPTSAGVVEAREILNAKMDGLKTQLAELKAANGSQAGGEKFTSFQEGLVRNRAKINKLFTEEIKRRRTVLEQLSERALESKLPEDIEARKEAQQENREFATELELLLNDYKSIIN